MRKFIYLFSLLTFLNLACLAQTTSNQAGKTVPMRDVTAKIEKENLVVNWNGLSAEKDYWEIQGSVDGRKFSTIGMVFGEDPASTKNGFKFKMPFAKIKPGIKYFRILQVDGPETAIASNTIKITK